MPDWRRLTMSIFLSEKFPCPNCGEGVSFDVATSVNADRRPDLREQILAGTFQRGTCGKCNTTFRIEPQLSYFDVGRKQWILIKPAADLANWIALEKEAQEMFDVTYGEEASPVAQEIGEGLRMRVTFGWPAFREKDFCAANGLDDVTVELLKISLVRGLDHSPLGDDVEMRLASIDSDKLVLTWVKSATERPVESIE